YVFFDAFRDSLLAAAETVPWRPSRPGLKGRRPRPGADHARPMYLRRVEVFELPGGKVRFAVKGGGGPVFSPDGKTLAALGYKTVRLLRTADGTQAGTLSNPGRILSAAFGPVTSLAFSPDGKRLACGMILGVRDGSFHIGTRAIVRLFDLDTGASRDVQVADAASAPVPAFSPDSGTLATGSPAGSILLWNMGELARQYALPVRRGGSK
ncbi:hypothetical protein LCGC14_2851960, partial [marine sediment metagenome]